MHKPIAALQDIARLAKARAKVEKAAQAFDAQLNAAIRAAHTEKGTGKPRPRPIGFDDTRPPPFGPTARRP